MTSQFERFRPLKVPEGTLFGTEGISPTEAGREDAQAAMRVARQILEDAARQLTKKPKGAG